MKLALKLAAGCAILMAAPASAQILGGSGGGGLGGSLGGGGGGLGGSLGGSGSGSLGGSLGGLNSGANGGLSGRLGSDVGLNGRAGRFDASQAVALNASTAASVEPGTIVRDTRGRMVGTVQAVRTTAKGAVDNVLVRVGDRVASLPAANFGVTGDVLVSGMTRAEVVRGAQQQQASQQGTGRAQQSSRSSGTARNTSEQ